MSIEIEVLNGEELWSIAKPLFEAVWPPNVVQKLPWGHVRWAHADLRVMIETPSDGLACHAGVYFRNMTWNGRKLHIGGVGGVSTRADCRRRGYASIALDAAIQTMRDREDVRFALLFCEPHNFAFYQSRGWHWLRRCRRTRRVAVLVFRRESWLQSRRWPRLVAGSWSAARRRSAQPRQDRRRQARQWRPDRHLAFSRQGFNFRE